MKRLFLLAALTLPLGVQATGASQHLRTVQASLDGHTFKVQLATTAKEREQGLMFVKHLPADQGMLFAFPQSSQQTFWMKNTLIPLDIVFFDKNLKLVSMQLNAAPCKADPCPLYPSTGPARYVLELPGGTIADIGANAGDVLTVKGDIGAVR